MTNTIRYGDLTSRSCSRPPMNTQRRRSRGSSGCSISRSSHIITSSSCSSLLYQISAEREQSLGGRNLGGRRAKRDAARGEGAVACGSVELVTDDYASQWEVK